ncbi:MAG: ATP synthase F1 subunit epsilon [Planctomycetes bacterium]|nr:ATP synthase F1 subunit epsilon [Planctomycetota bacterium]
MADSTFHCSVITPERAVLDCDATFVAMPAHDGEIGIMDRRSPLVCKLGVGTLRVESGGEKHLMLIEQGFAQVVGNRLTILTQKARKPEEIDIDSANQALTEATAMKITDEASVDARGNAIKSAKLQIKLSRTAE